MQMLEVESPYVHAMAGFSKQSCSGGVLMWNVPHPSNGMPTAEVDIAITLRHLPVNAFKVEAFLLDENKAPQVREL